MATPSARVTIEPAKPASGTHVRREANEIAMASPTTALLVPATAPLVLPAAPVAPPVIAPRDLDDGDPEGESYTARVLRIEGRARFYEEMFADAFSMWKTDRARLEAQAPALVQFFDRGGHLR